MIGEFKPLLKGVFKGLKTELILAVLASIVAAVAAVGLTWGMIPLSHHILGVPLTDGSVGLKSWLPTVFSNWIDSSTPLAAVQHTALLLFGIYVFKSGAEFLTRYLSSRLALDVERRLRQKATSVQLRRQPDTTSPDVGDVLGRLLEETRLVGALIEMGPARIVGDPVTALGLLATMAILSPTLSVIVLCALPFVWYSGRRFQRAIRNAAVISISWRASLSSRMAEVLRARKFIQASGAESAVEAHLHDREVRAVAAAKRLAARMSIVPPSAEVLAAGLGAMVLIYGGYLVYVEQSLNSAELLTFLTATLLSGAPMKRIGDVVSRWNVARSALQRIGELTSAPTGQGGWPGRSSWPNGVQTITVDEVVVNHPERGIVLDGTSFELRKGNVYALVGSSGAGKSTLLDVISGLCRPQSGSVLIDGRPLDSFSWDGIRNGIAYVPQETVVFHDTVRQNLTLGESGYLDVDLIYAMHLAHMDHVMMDWPDGLDTVVGEEGHRWSGGERQRLTLARVLLKNPDIILLDEPTAHLDPESERVIVETIKFIAKERIVLVATHRGTMAVKADSVIVLRRGLVAEEGSPDVLKLINGEFARMFGVM